MLWDLFIFPMVIIHYTFQRTVYKVQQQVTIGNIFPEVCSSQLTNLANIYD